MQLKAGVARSPRVEEYVVEMMIIHASVRHVIEKCSLKEKNSDLIILQATSATTVWGV